MKLSEICKEIENIAPLSLQEHYDNSGLIIGNIGKNVNHVLICIDVTEAVIEEAIAENCDLIISHHPLIFSGLKKFNGETPTEKIVQKALIHNIAVYAAHTNLDNVSGGVNQILCKKLGLKNTRILSPKKNILRKLITFCPEMNANQVRKALFDAGAGNIGNYDACSFNSAGWGTFRANESANPFVGEVNQIHEEKEIKIEVIYPEFIENRLLKALIQNHPYEEVAYDIVPLANALSLAGAGMIGETEYDEKEYDFLMKVKNIVKTGMIRHSELLNKPVKKVAVCGGSGSFLIKEAIAADADVFISGDIKYHDFQQSEKRIVIADIGHFESEQFAKELLFNLLNKKNSTFAVRISTTETNPVNYL
ncbi:MAG: Nif3-like dinuclear metal center hexameric protein [Lentimicrobiaceae bacterium]|nr:Nif3-like dinuclear metal center hexameric protein [Lentimicrobiaceae bacterium]